MLHIHFTAFDSFYGFPVNPTSVLIKMLPDYIADRLPTNVSLDSLTVVEVSVPAAIEAVDRLQAAAVSSAIAAPAAGAEVTLGQSPPSQACSASSSASRSAPSLSSSLLVSPSRSPCLWPSVSPSQSLGAPAARHLWIHLGVAPRSSGMRVEHQAVNELDFRIPDMRGLQPRHQPVVAAACAPFVLQTRVDVDLLTRLLQTRHPSACDSWDAGRYLCNCIYYYSLHQCEQRRRRAAEAGEDREEHDALFLHTPPFDQQSEGEQLRFLLDFLLTLSALWQQGRAFIPSPPCSAGSHKQTTTTAAVETGEHGVSGMGMGMLSDQIDDSHSSSSISA